MTQQSSKRKRGMISLVQFFEEHMSWIEPWPYIMKLICLIQWTLGLFNFFFLNGYHIVLNKQPYHQEKWRYWPIIYNLGIFNISEPSILCLNEIRQTTCMYFFFPVWSPGVRTGDTACPT